MALSRIGERPRSASFRVLCTPLVGKLSRRPIAYRGVSLVVGSHMASSLGWSLALGRMLAAVLRLLW